MALRNRKTIREQSQYQRRARVQCMSWASGNVYHNKVDDECTPDFACCQPSLFEQDAKKRWQHYRDQYGTAGQV
jgi:hypothetical protein